MREEQMRPGIGAREKRNSVRMCFLGAGVALVISGCAPAVADSQLRALSATPSPESPVPAVSTASPDASAADKLVSSITDAVGLLAAETPEPDAEELRAAFVSAGAGAAEVEVSIDTTPTGLAVDAMTAAVLVEDTCVFGHVRDGVATVTQLPVLADGRCFVGDQR